MYFSIASGKYIVNIYSICEAYNANKAKHFFYSVFLWFYCEYINTLKSRDI